VTRWKIAAVVLSGAILTASCSTGWSDDERDYLVARCLYVNPAAPCISIVETFEEMGCTVGDTERQMLDSRASNWSNLSSEERMEERELDKARYPSCYGDSG
jgi:hypothetical protein